MSRTVYLNGQWLPEAEARVSIFDRAFLMADAIYEVTCVLDGMLLDYEGHAARLRRSAGELGLTLPLDDDALLAAHHEIVARNGMTRGMIYLQLSRGVADRDFAFPPEGTAPTLVMFTQARDVLANPAAEAGASRSSCCPTCAGAGGTSRPCSFSIPRWQRWRQRPAVPTTPGSSRTAS